jgi:hypothetical protein
VNWHRASQILPRIVAYSYPYDHFPTTRGWAARQRQHDLPAYAEALPSDTEQFLSMDEAARCHLEGEDSATIWPQESSQWFAQAAADVLDLVEQAEGHIGNKRSKEFDSHLVDLRMLANLARYHSHRALAGFSWALFKRSQDLNSLDDAIRRESQAVAAWGAIVQAAGDVYHDDIRMGRERVDLTGHWRDELAKLQAGLESLEQERRNFQPEAKQPGPSIAHSPIRRAIPGRSIEVRATVVAKGPLHSVQLSYDTGGRDSQQIAMSSSGRARYRGVIPGMAVEEGLRYWLEAEDETGQRAHWPAQAPACPTTVAVTSDNTPPTVDHIPISSAPASQPLRITASVRDPAGVKWVRLRYRCVNQHFDYKTLPMPPSADAPGQYEATVPGDQITPEWDFMYFIEAADNHGNGVIFPNLEEETPYVVVRLHR